MNDLRPILVPIDFSDCSRKALEYAEVLAEAFDAEIHLLHVWEIPPYIPPEAMVGVPGGTTQTLTHTAHAHATQAMSAFEDTVKKPGTRIRQSKLESGDPSRTIVEFAKNEGHGLIVIGTHGRTGLGHLLMGSVAEKVLRRAHCPVFTVPCRTRSSGD